MAIAEVHCNPVCRLPISVFEALSSPPTHLTGADVAAGVFYGVPFVGHAARGFLPAETIPLPGVAQGARWGHVGGGGWGG